MPLDDIHVRAYVPADRSGWLSLRVDLWPDQLTSEADAWTARKDSVTLIAENTTSQDLVGFAEVSQRIEADGCESSPVAFLEGWYVAPNLRGLGIGAKSVRAAASWAMQQGLKEMASDSLLGDEPAFHAHRAVGFEEVERSVKYRLALTPPRQ